MKEKLKRVWRPIRAKLPSLSRRGKLIRNVVVILLLALLCWVASGAPPMSAEQEYYRAARRNLMGDTEILAMVDTSEWSASWLGGDLLVVAEDEARYVVCTSVFDLECWEKQGDVTIADVPARITIAPTDDHPFLLLTALPAVRAEVEFTLPPELNWSSYDDFEGVTLRGEAEGENGVFLFHFPDGLQEYPPLESSRQRQRQGEALVIFADMLRGRAEGYNCSVDVTVSLWDEGGSLIYDDVLTYYAGSTETP